MQCPNCRNTSEAEHVFCFKCGTKLGTSSYPDLTLSGDAEVTEELQAAQNSEVDNKSEAPLGKILFLCSLLSDYQKRQTRLSIKGFVQRREIYKDKNYVFINALVCIKVSTFALFETWKVKITKIK